eukprot:m.1411671 g.1411671  ORF g.1411671 m.1411671 type:complete len:123 (-) comp25028_c0_seq41:4574-4942(-)
MVPCFLQVISVQMVMSLPKQKAAQTLQQVNKPLVWFGMHHAPWDQIAVADFVMPFFLFIMGVGMALTFVKYPGKYNLLRKVVVRAGKLFVCIRASGLILIWVIEFTPSTKQFCMRSLPRPHT